MPTKLPDWRKNLGRFPRLDDTKRPVSTMPAAMVGGGTFGSGTPRADNIAPGTITDLVASFPPESGTANRIQYTFPGDDGFSGTASITLQFQLRYSTEGLIETELDWTSSTLFPGFAEWQNSSGIPNNFTLIELTQIGTLPGVDTWVAIRFRDPAGNVAGISNSVQVIIN